MPWPPPCSPRWLGAGPGAAQTLAAVKQRGSLVCGVSEGILGFSAQTEKGWSGFDVDLCRALAAAIFDDAGKVRYVPLNATERFAALQSGSIDVLSRNSTWTMSRETELKLVFPQRQFDPRQFEVLAFDHYYLQPMDGPDLARNTKLALEYCLANPRWKLSIQTHKLLGIR